MTVTPHSRRRVRSVRLAVLSIVLLPIAYVSSWLVLSGAVNHGIVNSNAAAWFRPVYRPLAIYCDLQYPGAGTLTRWWWNCTADPEVGEQQLGYFLGPQYPTLGIDK